jgi:hypothetical protein
MPHLGDTKVDVFDVSTGARENRFDLGSMVDALVFSPDGAKAYVSSEQVSSVFVIHVASGNVATISTIVSG